MPTEDKILDKSIKKLIEQYEDQNIALEKILEKIIKNLNNSRVKIYG